MIDLEQIKSEHDADMRKANPEINRLLKRESDLITHVERMNVINEEIKQLCYGSMASSSYQQQLRLAEYVLKRIENEI